MTSIEQISHCTAPVIEVMMCTFYETITSEDIASPSCSLLRRRDRLDLEAIFLFAPSVITVLREMHTKKNPPSRAGTWSLNVCDSIASDKRASSCIRGSQLGHERT
jgi:hypothetical protein